MRIIILLSTLLFCYTGYAQWWPEFQTYENDLIYPDSTLSLLKLHSDSLHIVYEESDVPVYYSAPQARGHYVRLKENVRSAMEDMRNDIPYHKFLEKYTPDHFDNDLLITKNLHKNSEGDSIVTFSSLELGPVSNHCLTLKNQPELYRQSVRGKWIIEYWPTNEYNEEYVDAYYFEEEFKSVVLPSRYCDEVYYSEVLIGLNEPLFSKDAREIRNPIGGWFWNDPEEVETDTFLVYVNKLTNKPVYTDYDSSDLYRMAVSSWQDSRLLIIDSSQNTPEFRWKLNKAYQNNLVNRKPNTDLNFYFNRYLSEEELLAYYRSYYIIGGGSRDLGPRSHLSNITHRGATIGYWEVFIKGHLDLLFDNVGRSSDLSLMDEYRNTYVDELIAINIEVDSLLIGTIFELSNTHELHYSGDIGRLGRVLAKLEINSMYKDQILSIIKDEELDDYNRVMFYYLFSHYNYNIEDKKAQRINKKDLRIAVNTLPSYISKKIQSKERKKSIINLFD